jgi:O-antigen ligase
MGTDPNGCGLPPISRTSSWAIELIGLLLFLAAAGWTFLSSLASGGDPIEVAAMLVAVVLVFWGARVLTGRFPSLVAAMVAVGIASAGVLSRADLFANGPLGGPRGYTNASAALYLQGVVVSLMLFVESSRALRVAALAATLGFCVATLLTGSQASNVLLALPAIALLGTSRRAAARVITLFLGLFLTALASTILIGATYSHHGSAGGITGLIDTTLSSRRSALWHDALVLTTDNPIVGVGPGRFRYESPVARSDRDAAWAHNSFLQQGAEGGVPALVLAVSIVVWAFVRLLLAPRARVASLGAASLAALVIHSCIDYLLHFPVLPLTVAALVGAGVGTGPPSFGGLSNVDDRRYVRA